MDKPVKHIVIVGGGTAGWLTAGLIAAAHCSDQSSGIAVTLIEAPDIPTIGVGEGTWPTMRDTLQKIGLSETDFICGVDASFKQGSQFNGWVNRSPEDTYYHPFVLPEGYFDHSAIAYWTQKNHEAASTGGKPLSFADALSVQSHLCRAGLAPKQPATPEYGAVANYAYHLDAGKFADVLTRHCTSKLGVKHVQAHVAGVDCDGDGYINAVTLKDGIAPIAGDLFIDCTGSRALLIGQHYGVGFTQCKDILFNDTALAVQVPYTTGDAPIASATLSTAMGAGWVWDIGLSSRRGVGYVYSSAHTDDTAAEADLRTYVASSLGERDADSLDTRKISFNPGHRDQFWVKNCVAIGMSAGFIEPLEASALVMVELSANQVAEDMPSNRAVMDLTAARFNKRFTYRWQRIIEFLKLHYVLSKRGDSDYWQDNRDSATIPDRLQNLLRLWQYQPPSRHDFTATEEVFSAASYQYVLYGMGHQTAPRATTTKFEDFKAAEQHVQKNFELARKYMGGLPTNRALIDKIKQNGLPKI